MSSQSSRICAGTTYAQETCRFYAAAAAALVAIIAPPIIGYFAGGHTGLYIGLGVDGAIGLYASYKFIKLCKEEDKRLESHNLSS